jgi:hypothetical protein
MDFLRTRLITDRTSATEVLPIDLPTNPISHLILTVEGYQMTDEATLAEILAFVNKVSVSRGGVTILNLESEDLYALNCRLYKKRPPLTNSITTDNATRLLGLIIPFGRKLMDPSECLPATPKGELTCTLDLTVLGTSIDNGVINLDCVQLPGASPKQYLKSSLKTIAAPGGTGEWFHDLPIGNLLVALLLRMVTFPATSSHAYGVDAIRILKDEKEVGFSAASTKSLVAEQMRRFGGSETTMLLQQQILPTNIVCVDFDPTDDDSYLLDTKGAASLKAGYTYGVNEALYETALELVQA